MSEVNKFLEEKGRFTVMRIKNKIIEERAVKSGNFLNSVAYEVTSINIYPELLIDWIYYGKYTDYWHHFAFDKIIEEELDSVKFENEFADALDKDIQNELDENIKDEY